MQEGLLIIAVKYLSDHLLKIVILKLTKTENLQFLKKPTKNARS